MADSAIIEKLRKLLATARDKAATENEQATALRLAQALMLKHGIESVDEKDGTVNWGNKIVDLDQRHHHVIAHAVGPLYGAKCIFSGDTFTYVGREDTRTAAELTTHYICDQIDMLYKAGLPKGMSKTERAQWRREFKVSCAVRVATRIQKMVEELRTNDNAAQEAVGCTALVVLNHQEQLESEIDGFFEEIGMKLGNKSIAHTVKKTEAGIRGMMAGEKVNIHKEVK